MHQIKRYVIVGVLSIVVNASTMFILDTIFGFWYIFSAVSAFLVGYITAFTLHKYWTFEKREIEKTFFQATSFFFISLGILGAHTLLLTFSVEVLHIIPTIAHVSILSFMAFVSFWLNRFITFRT
jgi:putative flippase GtrA